MLAKKLCTIKNVIRAIVVIYVIATLSQLTQFVDKHFDAVTVPSKVPGANVTVVGCVKKYRSFVENNTIVYFNLYYWFRVIFIHLVPVPHPPRSTPTNATRLRMMMSGNIVGSFTTSFLATTRRVTR